MKYILSIPLLIISFFVFFSCDNENYSPKPRTYFRINLPEKEYQIFDTIFPYSFEYPTYAKIITNNKPDYGKYWMNIFFPDYNATVHITYKVVNNNLDSLTENARKFVDKIFLKLLQ
jgi:gliding motility-associated lipoprotein GldD